MDTLENMRMFVRVVEAGSFTKAASLLSVATPQVSRAITELESRLRTRLLNRTTRHMSLTEAGERYLQRCEQILEYVGLAEAEAAGAAAQPSGKLRIHGTTSFGQHYLAPLIARYNQRFPDVLIDLVLAQRVPDMIEEGFDVSVVVARELADSALVSQRIGTTCTVLCASPQYLSKRGMPVSLEDLNTHTCLQLVLPDVPSGQWIFDGPDAQVFRHTRSTPLTVNVAEALAEAIREGMGIGPLPLSLALQGFRDGSLVRVLDGHRLQSNNIYALYASRQYLDAKIRTFVEFLRENVPIQLAEQERELFHRLVN
ncbi:bacterial regulatory helix-turn-helix, lysR family protein [Paraburkholderia xenovorans LB400]|uniref:Transcriptional regulator, LysR family n=1 Tax=Paraburkholderia xenovorans (strain LB400) TaxID=266265 RepID=Q143T5_PARXL|nr:LysR family transcriptional regulator [Paraburkholderia xenovorans]ABE29404.1 transcriptional regulator, LysR family [Paraburkholderia xenovorans LB400]AIP29642.1 bacterial regulatory helix-turn-helix, lysR family protein [Paraburkholderia xenovorans LB400]